MSDFEQLQQKIRRSSQYQSIDIFNDYMEYASKCQDEIEIYQFMEQNKIVSGQIQFYSAYMIALKRRCQFRQILKILRKIKIDPIVNKQFLDKDRNDKYWTIQQFEQNLTYELQKMIRMKRGRRKRSTEEFIILSLSKIQKKKRKVGGLEIYIDENCRESYKLQDYVEFIELNLKDELQMRMFDYEREQKSKPLSFLGMNKVNLDRLAFQLIELNKRNSLKLRQTLYERNCNNNVNNINKNNRFSISRKSNLINPEMNCHTPKASLKKNYLFFYESPSSKHKDNHHKYQTLKMKSYKKQTTHTKSDKKTMMALSQRKQQNFESRQLGQEYESSQIARIQVSKIINGVKINDERKQNQQYHRCQNRERNQILDKAFSIQKGIVDVGEMDFSDNLSSEQFNKAIDISQFQIEQANQQNQEQIIVQVVKNCLTSTQSLTSIDSNQENIFSNKNKKSQQFKLHRIEMRKDRKAFQQLKEDDLNSISNFSMSSFIQNNSISDDNSEDGRDLLCEMIEKISGENNNKQAKQNKTQNYVLETLRKQKLSTILIQSNLRELRQAKDRDNDHQYHTNSDRKHFTKNHLPYISEQKSYNSERKQSAILSKRTQYKQLEEQKQKQA